MKYRDRTTGRIYNSLFEVQQQFSNVSFPFNWDATTYDFANVDMVIETPQPQPHRHNRIDFGGVQLIDGVWTEVWNEVPKYDDPTEQAAWEVECLETQWGWIRTQRNILLAETDYTQLSDTPISTTAKTEFLTYRQALRNITAQSDPYNIIWPTKPLYQAE